jgi:hypothetical protein
MQLTAGTNAMESFRIRAVGLAALRAFALAAGAAVAQQVRWNVATGFADSNF